MHKYFFAVFFLFLGRIIYSQDIDSINIEVPYPFIIDSISITGNDITEQEIIIRELTFRAGDTLTAELAEYNKERIFSLGIFTKVDLVPSSINDLNYINILVEESWYIYPIPFAQLRDKDWNKISYGLYLVVKNFRGRNETLQSRVAFGYDPSFDISYYKPSVTKGSNLFFRIEAAYQDVSNRSLTAERIYGSPFEQKFILGQVTLGKRFGLFHWLSGNLNYNYVETPFHHHEISISDQRIEHFPSAGINYTYDTRDLAQFPKNGILFWSSLQLKGWGINDINYSIFNIDFREYRNITGSFYAKWRLASRISFGEKIPFYDYSYIGLSERIRGHFNVRREGHNSYISSLEIYHPIIKDLNISFDWVPLLPRQLLRYRVGLYAQLFVDTGTTQLRGRPISINKFDTGFGGGLTFLVLPYNSIRIEFAMDEFNNSEFIFDLGISF